MRLKAFYNALAQTRSPCDMGCRFEEDCKTGLSCLTFNSWAETGRLFPRMVADVPTQAIFERQLLDGDLESSLELNAIRKNEI